MLTLIARLLCGWKAHDALLQLEEEEMLTRLLRSLFIGPDVTDELIDTLIKPPQVKYAAHDESLRLKTEQKRKKADQWAKAARRLETMPLDERLDLRRVK